MNDTAPANEPRSDALPPAPAAPPLAPSPAPSPAPGVFMSAVALALALAALLLVGWGWYAGRGTTEALRQELAKRLADADTQIKAMRVLADKATESSTEAQVKLGVLENRVAESQNQQIALEALYQELSRNRDEWAYAEIEQSLFIASQQLQLAGNVKAALIALQNADGRLQRMDRPMLTPLRKAINQDIEKLKALPFVDTVGIALRLDNVMAAVDRLPLAMELRPVEERSAEAPKDAPASTWQRFLREAWGEMKQLVRVQHLDRPELPLLAPQQVFFLRENLKMRLLGARLALLARDQASYKADLQAAREWLARYYDTRDKAVGTVQGTLANLYHGDIGIDLPDITATLDALRTARAARDRPVR